MTDEELKIIRARCEAATRRPDRPGDLLVHAREDIPALLDEVERLRTAIETHRANSFECPRCGHSESCASDDVCLALAGAVLDGT
jgi:hypothetical protein